jgi:dienelactone hydrolase
MRQLLGKYFSMAEDGFKRSRFPMSFLAEEHKDVDKWREEAKALVWKLLSFNPPETPMDVQTHDEYLKDGLIYKHVSYSQPYGPRTEGILMRPEKSEGKLPGILGLHDHGGYKYYGKEKITAPKNAPAVMKDFQNHYYEGRAWASELALKGYAVFVPDVFLWGSRKIEIEDVPEWYAKYDGLDAEVDSPKHIEAYNRFAGEKESDIAKAFFTAGITWPGVMLYDDMRALDFLTSLADVDADNIGCGGLSGGGLRTVFLAGMDDRVKASVCAGFMSTSSEFALYKVYTHTWMYYLPGLTALMDFTDLYSLRGKKPTMVLYDEEDQLFTPKGQEDAHKRFLEIYTKMGNAELYDGQFFPGPHKFDIEMQEIAFKFYDKWLKKV